MFQDPRLVAVLLLLALLLAWGASRAGAGIASRTAQWWVWGTLLFLTWLLGGFASLYA